MCSTSYVGDGRTNCDEVLLTFTSTGRKTFLCRIAALIPHECHDEAAAHRLAERIASGGIWTAPVAVEQVSGVVLDGHHRRRAAQLLGLAAVPVMPVEYGDPGLELAAWRVGETWSPEVVLQRARAGTLLPYKTTRHIFSPPIGEITVSLDSLR